ncbi:MAG: thioredoxin family protein [archaeon]
MKIEIFTVESCGKCPRAIKNIKKANKDLKAYAKVKVYEDPAEAVAHGFFSVPGIEIDGKMKAEGESISYERAKEIIEEEM